MKIRKYTGIRDDSRYGSKWIRGEKIFLGDKIRISHDGLLKTSVHIVLSYNNGRKNYIFIHPPFQISEGITIRDLNIIADDEIFGIFRLKKERE